MVIAIIANSKTISISAVPMSCWPKKSHDHKPFNKSWTIYSPSGINISFAERWSQTIQADILMARYNIPQTGPKIQPGGVQIGFSSVKYHSPGLNWEAIAATPKVRSTKKARPIIFINLLFTVIESLSINSIISADNII